MRSGPRALRHCDSGPVPSLSRWQGILQMSKQARRHEATCPRSRRLEGGRPGLGSNPVSTASHQLLSTPGDKWTLPKDQSVNRPRPATSRASLKPLLSPLSTQPDPWALGRLSWSYPGLLLPFLLHANSFSTQEPDHRPKRESARLSLCAHWPLQPPPDPYPCPCGARRSSHKASLSPSKRQAPAAGFAQAAPTAWDTRPCDFGPARSHGSFRPQLSYLRGLCSTEQ